MNTKKNGSYNGNPTRLLIENNMLLIDTLKETYRHIEIIRRMQQKDSPEIVAARYLCARLVGAIIEKTTMTKE